MREVVWPNFSHPFFSNKAMRTLAMKDVKTIAQITAELENLPDGRDQLIPDNFYVDNAPLSGEEIKALSDYDGNFGVAVVGHVGEKLLTRLSEDPDLSVVKEKISMGPGQTGQVTVHRQRTFQLPGRDPQTTNGHTSWSVKKHYTGADMDDALKRVQSLADDMLAPKND